MTLIELIFAMVIVAVVFSVIPRILAVSNRSMQLSIKEDALFDGVTLTHLISRLAWDEHTIQSGGEILIHSGGVECDPGTGYRIGGFRGSRNCLLRQLEPDDQPNGCDDVDDFNDSSCYSSSTRGGRLDYNLSVEVARERDTKQIVVRVGTHDGRVGGEFNASFGYDSINLGHIGIQRRYW